jgi:acylglycerol lipase
MPTEVEGTHKIGELSLYTKTWLVRFPSPSRASLTIYSQPDGAPKAKLIFVHGFNDHINRYYGLFPYLAERGIATYGFDQRGWGRSVPNPSHRGLTGPTSLVISDIASFIRAQLPSTVPVFVAGHSMGGGEVLTLASDPAYEDLIPQIRGWVLESPFIGFAKEVEPSFLKVFFGRLAGKLLPTMKLANPIPPENVTRDPEVVRSLTDDKLLHGMGTLEGLSALLDRTARLGGGDAKLSKGVRAVWLGCGTEDKGVSYDACKKWFGEQTQLQDKEFKSYDGWSHQLHADLADNRDVFSKDVADFILARCGEERGEASKL